MTKPAGIAGVVIVAVLLLSGLGASTASASFCAKVSKFENAKKAGNWVGFATASVQCGGTQQNALTARFVLVLETLKPTVDNLYCVKILLGVNENANGFWEDEDCTIENPAGKKNQSNYSEIEVPGPVVRPLGGAYPKAGLLLNASSSSIATQLQTSAAKPLSGTGLKLELTFLDPNVAESLVRFQAVKKSSSVSCNTEGLGSGEVLIKGAIRLVYDSLSSESGGLGVGTLFEIPETTIKCFEGGTETAKIKVKGSSLGLVKPINKEVEAGSNTIEGSLYCSSTTGKPAETRYWNESGELKESLLEVEAGLGIERGCELIGGSTSQVVTLLPNEMLEIAG